MAFFASPRLSIEDTEELQDKICRIENIITLLETAIENAAIDGTLADDVKEYRLDDGQTRINVAKRSVKQMTESINEMVALKNYYVNKYNGWAVRLVDHEATRLLTRF